MFRYLMAVVGMCFFVAASYAFPTDGLLAHFDASKKADFRLEGEYVAAWTSTTGSTDSATASDAQRPRYVARTGGILRSAVLFDGTDDVLCIPSFNRTADTWSLVVVAAPYAPCAGGGICSARSRDGHDYDPGFTVDLYQSGTAFDQVSIEGAGRIGGQRDQMTHSYPCGGFHVITVIRGAEQIWLYVDGLLEGTRPVSPAKTIMDELRIGARYFAGSERNYFHGEMATVLLYDHALTDADRAAEDSKEGPVD